MNMTVWEVLTEICQKGEREERITRYAYNAFGEVTCIQDALGHKEEYTYDSLGRIVKKIDQEGLTTRWAYTPMGQVEGILYGEGKEIRYTYNLS